MSLNRDLARECLAAGDLKKLFIEALGWDRHAGTLQVNVVNATWSLQLLAQKRGMVACLCPTPDGQPFPDRALRGRIERQVAKSAHEHLIVFADPASGSRIWQWVKREPGKPAAVREHTYYSTQSGEALLQKLAAIAFTLDEEEDLTLTDVTRRAGAAFDVERVTRRFYDRFQKEHRAFLKFISGITDSADHEWYASVMLNRLMFVYFIQRKGFLDGDHDYLRNRLNVLRRKHGRDKFYSFYRYFLLRLFHEGLGGRERSDELEALIGRIPYLNGGLFDIHELERPERYGDAIRIPDEAFERIFDYFDQYQWHLDERPLRADNEINPDVLGYIFEKYVNQKQMGAYYTKEDITEYIGKNTVLPFLFDAARAKCKIAFENPNGSTVWDLLRENPDGYIYPAMRHGMSWDYRSDHIRHGEPLSQPYGIPDSIAAGINPPTLHDPVGEVESINDIETIRLRKDWNKPAPPTHALPTETWREVIARRQRYEETRTKLAAGEVHDINDLITLNLDIRQFAQDVIAHCEGPDLLRAFWRAIENVTILDPTCGSGAFLFAALQILEPLYDACLERMEAFVEELDRSKEKHRPEKYSDFRKILARVAAHPNRRYFIFKSIILNNLYGVDIMEEAVEICKLRLFLKLAAQVEPSEVQDNLGIEPLPDIDFNIRAGNTLVGFTDIAQIRDAAENEQERHELGRQGRMTFESEDRVAEIERAAADLQQSFDAFRARQIEGDGSVPTEDKQELRRRLNELDGELNRYLAGEYGIDPAKTKAYDQWLKSHQPFHWFVEFYGIMSGGGFDVIIGNPPWKEYAAVNDDYKVRNYHTERAGNLYAFCSERSLKLMTPAGRFGFIVQLPAVCSSRMIALREMLIQGCDQINVVPFDDRPGKLFEGLQNCRCTILIARKGRPTETLRFATTRYNRWATVARSVLFHTLDFARVTSSSLMQRQLPKVASPLAASALTKCFADITPEHGTYAMARQPADNYIFYQEATRYWIKATVGVPYYSRGGHVSAPLHGRYVYCSSTNANSVICAALNSSLFYTYFITYGDCFHLGDALVRGFPFAPTMFDDDSLREGNNRLMKHLKSHATKKHINTRSGDAIAYDEFNVAESKTIIDDIDCDLARHYGFTEQELDFIVNYDIKYRMGRAAEGEDG